MTKSNVGYVDFKLKDAKSVLKYNTKLYLLKGNCDIFRNKTEKRFRFAQSKNGIY